MGLSRFQKIEQAHKIELEPNRYGLVVELHIMYEVTSAQAFPELEQMGISVLRPENTMGVTDHVVATGGTSPKNELLDELLIEHFEKNCRNHGIEHYGRHNGKQGICHVLAPELGLTRPNSTIFCGDSHTATHGAFGAIAAGIGTSTIRDILATGCILDYTSPKQFKIEVSGKLAAHLSAKDLILYIISQIGNEWATGGAVFFTGDAIRDLSMEGRMTLCNMTIEFGGRFGYCDVDEKTIDWFRQSRTCFDGLTDAQIEQWYAFNTDEDAEFDRYVKFDASDVKQMVSYGLNLNEVIDVEGATGEVEGVHESRQQWELPVGTLAKEMTFHHAFIGSCTNGRVEDFVAAADVIKRHGGKIQVQTALAVPGSIQVKERCEELGLDRVFIEAGFEWRDPGCSSCCGMNPDKLVGRIASSSNRNFPGRQGPGSRTYLMSPSSVALAALEGKFCDLKSFIETTSK